MQFLFEIREIFKLDSDEYAILTANDIPKHNIYYGVNNPKKTKAEQIAAVIDEIGIASSRSQGLSTTITTYSRFIYSNHKLFIKFDKNLMIGFIKIGVKNLIYNDWSGKMKEVTPMCILDFYVEDSMQRHGYGKQIFEKMLAVQGSEPRELAIDRPSGKFIAFLKKHYNLKNFRPQTNKFVIFDDYFENTDSKKKIDDEKKNHKIDPEVLKKSPDPDQIWKLNDNIKTKIGLTIDQTFGIKM